MSYSFARDRSATDNARTMALGQIDKIGQALEADLTPAEFVHYARRRLKRVRAALALAASGFEPAKVRAADRLLRDIARQVAPLRDRELVRAVSASLRPLLATSPEIVPILDAVDRALMPAAEAPTSGPAQGSRSDRAPAPPTAPPSAPLAQAARQATAATAGHRRTTRARRETAPGASGATAEQGQGAPVSSAPVSLDVADFQRKLARARRMITGLPEAVEDPEAPLRALVHIYRQARKSMNTALASGLSEDYHEWRKPAQRLARQLKLTAALLDGRLGERQAETRLLARTLGEDHDLAVLQAWVAAEAAGTLSAPQRALLDGLVIGMQVALRREAASRGAELFAEPAAAFERMLRKLWSSQLRERGDARGKAKD